MIVKRNNFKNIERQNYSIAVGNFDGIHKGHKYLLDALLKYKKTHNSKVAVLSFTPHPVKIMAPDKWKKNLVRFRTKYEKLKFLGLDALFLLSFSKKFSETSAEQFIVKYLINMLNVKNIVVGEDFRFGYNREGNVNLLKKYQEKGAFYVEAIKKKSDNNNNIFSSSLIRDLVKNGNIIKANTFLGHNWQVQGRVVRGNALGRTLGFPTANLKYMYQISPQRGIYACWTQIEGETKWRMQKRNITHKSRAKKSLILIHSKKKKHRRVWTKDFKILGRGYSSDLRKISKALFIKQMKPDLNIQKEALKLKLSN